MAVKEKTLSKSRSRLRRRRRVRKKVWGTAERPRVSVYRSLNHIYAQAIDDTSGHTLVSASSLDKEIIKELGQGSNMEAAKKVGELFAGRVKDKGIASVVFDRNGYLFGGRVKALADEARKSGLKF